MIVLTINLKTRQTIVTQKFVLRIWIWIVMILYKQKKKSMYLLYLMLNDILYEKMRKFNYNSLYKLNNGILKENK